MNSTPPPTAFDYVLFGATGDLAARKLFPGLYQAYRDGALHQDGRIIAVSRSVLTTDAFAQRLTEKSKPYIKENEFDQQSWQAFLTRIIYLSIDVSDLSQFSVLKEILAPFPERDRIFYLSTGPEFFAPICEQIGALGLVTPQTRVAVEKPLGSDLTSAQAINDLLARIFDESQIYRIDHYLGKETVQNLMALRFGNTIFEPLWQRGWISHVQITVAESLGVEERGGFYDHIGAMRDMVQNHLLQTLCIVAMEPPASMQAEAVRFEKLKVLKALRPIVGDRVAKKTVRGQYRAGAIDGEAVLGYLSEANIPAHSQTETFVMIKAELNNWRWAGVPFYLRTGKRMQERLTEIVVYFRAPPVTLFKEGPTGANRLVIRLQPEESVELHMMAKEPGVGMRLSPVNLNLDFSTTFSGRQMEAYERLQRDLLLGRSTLFLHREEMETAWRWVDPIIQTWRNMGDAPKLYPAGSWGPAVSSSLIGRDGFAWHEEN